MLAKGRVGPGQMLVIDTLTGQILDTQAIATLLKEAHPYRKWLREEATRIRDDERLEEELAAQSCRGDKLKTLQKCITLPMKSVRKSFVPMLKMVKSRSVQWG